MRSNIKGLLAIIVASTSTLSGCQLTKAQAKSAQTSQTAKTKGAETKTIVDRDESITLDAWVVTDNQVFIPMVDKLGEHIAQARQNYLKGDNTAAAIAMREGSAFLMQEMPNTSSKAQANLKQASDELMEKASLVQMGEIDSVRELDPILVKAYQADTQHRWLYIDESEWMPLVKMPQQHFSSARHDFLHQDYSQAAIQIRKGAEFIKLETNRTRDSDLKSSMLSSAHDLEQLAQEVKRSQVNSVNQLDKAFARGQLAMGEFFSSKAQESESRGQLEIAGQEMIGAFEQMQGANTWLNKDKANLKQAQIEINRLQNSLGLPNEAQSKNLGKAIAIMDEQVETLTQEIIE